MTQNTAEKCLIEDCPNAALAGRRGLCGTHYNKFIDAKKLLPEAKQDRFEEIAVQRKQILPAQAGGRPKTSDVFAELAQEVLQGEETLIARQMITEMKKRTSKNP